MILLIRSRPCTYLGAFFCISLTDWDNMDDRNRVEEIRRKYDIRRNWRIDRWPHIDITDANKDDILNDDDCNDIKMYSMVSHFDKIEELMAPWGEIHKHPIES